MKKNILVTATVLGSLLVSAQAMAGASGNIGVTSNYIWRGVEQAGGDAAVSGGLDYEAESGAYVGTWASSLGGGNYELDLYGGYAGATAAGMDYDVGVIAYLYPVGDDELDFTEVYGSVGYNGLSGEIAYTVSKEADTDDENDLYYAVGYSGEMPKNGVGYGIKVGHYDIDGSDDADYTHYQVSLSKGDFTFAVDANDIDGDDDPRVSVAWGKSFDF